MKTILVMLVLAVAFVQPMYAQVDSTESSDDLLTEILGQDTTVALLPDRIMFTQRIFWGKKGLMRNFHYFELTPEKRARELKLRRFMLGSHQVLGFATAAAMIAQGFVGASLYKGNDVEDLHEALAVGVNVGYFSTAALTLFAPPKMIKERKGYSSIKLHKALAYIHFSGMLLTDILALSVEDNPRIRPYHRAAAFSAFGAFTLSMIVIKF